MEKASLRTQEVPRFQLGEGEMWRVSAVSAELSVPLRLRLVKSVDLGVRQASTRRILVP